jgi:hypothetical protein
MYEQLNVRISAMLSEQQKAKLDEYCKLNKTTISEAIRDFVKNLEVNSGEVTSLASDRTMYELKGDRS